MTLTQGRSNTLVDLMSEVIGNDDHGAGLYLYRAGAGADLEKSFDRVSSATLFREALSCASALRGAGIEADDYCLVACTSIRATLVGFFAAVAIGAIPTVQPEAAALGGAAVLAERLATWCQWLGPRTWVLIEPKNGREVLKDVPGAKGIIPVGPDPAPRGENISVEDMHPARPDDVAFVQITSGTTGSGNAVAVSHGNIFTQVAGLAERLQWGPETVLSSWAPLYHDMGLVGGALAPILMNTTGIVFRPSNFLMAPSMWLRSVAAFSVTNMVMPDFGYSYCAQFAARKGVPEDVDLSSIHAACTSAEPVRERTLRAFCEQFEPHGFDKAAFTPCFGLAETTLAATVQPADKPAKYVHIDRGNVAIGSLVKVVDHGEFRKDERTRRAHDNVLTLFSNGPPLDGCAIEILGGDGKPLDDGMIGEISVAGPIVARGYVDEGGNGITPFPGDRVRTGDIGFMRAGEVYVVDRLKNVIIRYGKNFGASEIEQALSAPAEIADNRIMVLETDIHVADAPVVAMVEARKPGDRERILTTVGARTREMDLPVDELIFVRPGKLPKTTSGKKRYGAAREALSKEKLAILSRHALFDGEAPTESANGTETETATDRNRGAIEADVVDIVTAIAEQNRPASEITLHSKLAEDIGIDSLQVFEIGLAVQERFGIEFWEEDLVGLRTVNDIVERIEALQQTRVLTREVPEGEVRIGLSMIDAVLVDQLPQLFTRVTEQNGRRLVIDGREVIDYASCNYLGLDLHPDVIGAIPPMVEKWGVHPSWTRAVASPKPYIALEERISQLMDGVPVVVFPSVTLLHMGVLPEIAGRDGVIFVDNQAHTSIREACFLAEGKGTRVEVWPHMDLDVLEDQLRKKDAASRCVIAVDGVYSMTGRVAPLVDLLALAEKHDALLYVDDAHGFGVLGGAKSPDAPYGRSGNGSAKYLTLDLDNERLIYVAGLSKAYSSMGAFIVCSNPHIKRVAETSSTYVFSGPVPVASLASALAGMAVNEREGDRLRKRLAGLTRRLTDGVQAAGFKVDGGGNDTGFPIVHVALDGSVSGVIRACRRLWDRQPALLLTPAVYPSVPLGHGGLRLQITAAHSDADIDDGIAALTVLRE